jgi:anti-sigma factor RsiW
VQCNDILREIQELDGDNPMTDQQRLHFDSCPSCREQMEALRDALTLLRTAPHEAPAPGFADRVMRQIALERAEALAQAPSRRVALVGLAVAAAAMAALGLVWAGSGAAMALGPGSTLLAGAAGLVASFANVLVAATAVVRAMVTAARSLPTDLLEIAQYCLNLFSVIAFIVVLWLAGRGRRAASSGNGLV